MYVLSALLRALFLTVMHLLQVGPRFVLNPIKMFSHSFAGATLYENPDYVSPNLVSACVGCPL
jgi:hypothetical protein